VLRHAQSRLCTAVPASTAGGPNRGAPAAASRCTRLRPPTISGGARNGLAFHADAARRTRWLPAHRRDRSALAAASVRPASGSGAAWRPGLRPWLSFSGRPSHRCDDGDRHVDQSDGRRPGATASGRPPPTSAARCAVSRGTTNVIQRPGSVFALWSCWRSQWGGPLRWHDRPHAAARGVSICQSADAGQMVTVQGWALNTSYGRVVDAQAIGPASAQMTVPPVAPVAPPPPPPRR
jgi:hypothetical protein